MHRTGIAAIVITAATAMTNADIVRVDEFQSLQFEGFESTSAYMDYGSVEVFGGMGSVFNSDDSWVHTADSDLYIMTHTPYEGTKQFGAMNGGIAYSFTSGQRSFGGFFSSVSDSAGGEVRIYAGDILLGTDTLNAPVGGAWAWNGWTSDTEFDRVEIRSNYTTAGYLLHDAVRVLTTQVPTPGGGMLLMGGMLVLARRRR